MSRSGEPLVEEPWEAEVGRLLGGLPSVEPPAGFIDRAIDRRPPFAARTLLGLLALTALTGLAALSGAVERRAVVPPLDELVARHDLAARAGLIAPPDSDGRSGGGSTPADRADPIDLPAGFENEGAATVEDIRQAVYARGDEAISVFVQAGRVDWPRLGDDERSRLGGRVAWVDRERSITVIEVDGSVVTVIGLHPTELERAIGTLDGDGSRLDRVGELADAVLAWFGYAPVG